MGDASEKKGKGKKKEDYTDVVVLNTDIHCIGCAMKIKQRALKFKGVMEAQVDMSSNKVTVKGEFNSSELHQHLENKPHKKFEIVSNQHKPKKTSTVGLKVGLYCHACIQTVNKIKRKVAGVQEVIVDAENDHVTVKGTMDVDSLVQYLSAALGRIVEVVPA